MTLAGICGLLLCGATPTQATTIEHESFRELVQKADLIAVARVTSVSAYPTTDGRHAYTYTELADLEVLKGAYPDATLTLRNDGGPLGDGRVLAVAGMPQFNPEERVVVFVRGNTERICPLVGWSQGLLHVEQSKESGAAQVITTEAHRAIRAIRGEEFVVAEEKSVDGARTADRSANADAEGGELTLDGLRNEIRAAVTAGGASMESHGVVASATLKVDGPGSRPDRQLKRRD
jgi:hypothetical protein